MPGRFSCSLCIQRIEEQAREAVAKQAEIDAKRAGRPGPCGRCGRTVEVAGHRYCHNCRRQYKDRLGRQVRS